MTISFEEIEMWYDDLSPNGQWLVDEVRRLHLGEEAFIAEQQRLNQRFQDVYNTLKRVSINPNEPEELLQLANKLVNELIRLRATEAAPLSDFDRVGTIIEAVGQKVYDERARKDITWLTQEIAKLRALVKWVNQQLDISNTGVWVPSEFRDNTREIVNKTVARAQSQATELAEIHDILAEALGYEKAPTTEEDPNCPCPGQYITGEHTAVTMAMQAARWISRFSNMFMDKDTLRLVKKTHKALSKLLEAEENFDE